ncbi:hypothetical protein DdX_15757 [Ditylenchus destructor]|uniref:Uncharacterized protein n=1 Tax=Ditylenchus destructor TaxID=166010 RepID=A0AAD4MQ89_9BILA|nr:hypothetical protein DdX_15757 [Ditylenchus destructor]
MLFKSSYVNSLVCMTLFGLMSVHAKIVMKEQTIWVIGEVHCHDNNGNAFSSNDELVQLFASDGELLSQTRTDVTKRPNATFVIQGKRLAGGINEPYVKVLAKCEDPNIHIFHSYLASRCSFEASVNLDESTLIKNSTLNHSRHLVVFVIDTRKAKIVCDQSPLEDINPETRHIL